MVAVLALVAPSCSSHSGMSTSDAQDWATVNTVNALYGHLLDFLVVAESSIRTLSQQKDLQTRRAKNYLSGAQTAWQNVVAQLTNFTSTQAKAVPTLATTIGILRLASTQWLDALYAANKKVQSGEAKSFSDIAPLFHKAQVAEAQVRARLRTTAAAIATQLCDIETRNPGLTTTGSPSGDCAGASQLSS